MDLRNSASDGSQGMIDAEETEIVLPIHKHPTKDESFVILRGKVRVTTNNADGSIIEEVALNQERGNYGADIPKNVWHKLESLESGSVIFECKEGPFVEHEVEGVLKMSDIRSKMLKSVLKGIWAFCSYVFVPQRGRH